ncbi:hypothetical protein BDR04DRAFT_1121803 [Suillus decipiens]|nr:hypothetical protein BDR04DRAFT_1121803 [Suillus decipiens]
MPKVCLQWRYTHHFAPLTMHCNFPPEHAPTPPLITQHKVFVREVNSVTVMHLGLLPDPLTPSPLPKILKPPGGNLDEASDLKCCITHTPSAAFRCFGKSLGMKSEHSDCVDPVGIDGQALKARHKLSHHRQRFRTVAHGILQEPDHMDVVINLDKADLNKLMQGMLWELECMDINISLDNTYAVSQGTYLMDVDANLNADIDMDEFYLENMENGEAMQVNANSDQMDID